jgi:hypothetical protein
MYEIHHKYRNPGTLPIENFAQNSGRTLGLVDCNYPTVKEEFGLYSSQYSVRFSVHPNDITVNLTA